MPLKPDVQGLLEQFEAQGLPPFDQMSVSQARDVAGAFRDLQGEPEPVAEIRDILVPGPAGNLPVRVYDPSPGTPLPLLVYYHGGGWVIGNIEVVDKPARALANASQCVVAATQYRLSPETKFPGPVEDCYAATKWLAEHAGEVGGDASRLVVAGDSAGGNLAAAVTLMARDRGGPQIAYQLLIYPVTSPARGNEFASYRDNADGYLLTRGGMEWFWDHYVSSPQDDDNPYAAPLKASDLSGLPPAMVITAEFDPLRDEGAAYADRLQQAGVKVKSTRYDGVIHGFFWMGGVLEDGRAVLAEMGEELRKQFG
ncbi:MAG: alpha/beta hydrolase fold domain-containing protein [Pseudonocardiaceae bacterium]|nr:alpha/beta hydrolase fold domain-containing protein [Pseudonocardiaceae bacterium]